MHSHENRHAERMRIDPAYRADALAERERIKAIVDFGLKAGGGSAVYRLAVSLACETDMTAEAALRVLERMPQAPEPERRPAQVAVPTTDFDEYMRRIGATRHVADDKDPILGKEPETVEDLVAISRALEKRSRG